MDLNKLKALLLSGDPEFWPLLASFTRQAHDFEELFLLSSLRKKAHARQPDQKEVKKLKLAILGGYSLYPLHELIEHVSEMENFPIKLWKDDYISEIMDEESGLYSFAPKIVFLLPADRRCAYTGKLTDPRELPEAEARQAVDGLLELARKVNAQIGAEVLMANFMLPARHDPGGLSLVHDGLGLDV